MSFFQKFVIKVCEDLSRFIPTLKPPKEAVSCIEEIRRPVSKGEQVFTETEGPMVVGKSMTHASALKQVTGEAVYVDDIPHMHDELYAVIVGSAHAHANIL
jgi:xanthine dehydrogenase/oxidase